MARRKNPEPITLLLLGGSALAAYLFFRKKTVVASAPTPQQPLEPPAAEQPPTPDEAATSCYEAARPAPRAGYDLVCRNGLWKYRKSRQPISTTLLPLRR